MCDAVFDNIGISSSIRQDLISAVEQSNYCRLFRRPVQAELQSTAMKEKEIIGIRGNNRRV